MKRICSLAHRRRARRSPRRSSQAVTLRVSNQGDVQSMDPHSLNESLQLSFTGNVYESLVERDKNMGLAPALATKWTQTEPDGLALRPAPGREIPRRHAVHGRRRGLHLQARGRRRLAT